MKSTLFTSFWLLLASFSLAAGENALPPEAQKLQEQFIEARNRAVAPIEKKYREELVRLLDSLTKAGRLEDAMLVKKEIERTPRFGALPMIIESYRDILPAIPDSVKAVHATKWTSSQRITTNAEFKRSLIDPGSKAKMHLKVSEVADWSHGVHMTLYSDIQNQEGYLIRVFCKFSNDWKPKLTTLKKNDAVLVRGGLESVDYRDLWGAFTLHVVLKNCSFEK